LRVALLVLAVVLSGCSLGPTVGGETPTATVTPVPVPDDPADRQGAPQPGITAEEVRNVSAVVAAHRAVLATQTYVWELTNTRRLVGENGTTVLAAHNETVWLQSERRYRQEIQLSPETDVWRRVPGSQISVFANGTHKHKLVRSAGNSSYAVVPLQDSDDQFAFIASAGFRQAFTVERIDVSRVRVDGSTYYRLVGRNATDMWFRGSENYTAVAYVEPSGLIRNLTVTVEQPRRTATVEVRYAFEYRHLGEVTVDPPAWVDEGNASRGVPGGGGAAGA
jgi:hypothetical protein